MHCVYIQVFICILFYLLYNGDHAMEPYTEKEIVILKRCIIFHYIDGLIFFNFPLLKDIYLVFIF